MMVFIGSLADGHILAWGYIAFMTQKLPNTLKQGAIPRQYCFIKIY
jgi:hypothetical protein